MTNLPENDPLLPPHRANRVDYSALVNDSFRVVKNHRALWIAGMLAVLLQGGMNINLNYNVSQPARLPTGQPGEPVNFQDLFAGTPLADIIANPIPYIIGAAVLMILFFLIRLIFGTWAQAALISMANEVETAGRTSLGRGWRLARGRLASLIGFQFLLALPIILLVVVILATLFPFWLTMMRTLMLPPGEMERAMTALDPSQFAGFFCMIPVMLCAIFPIIIVMAIINIYGFRSCLLAGTGAFASIGRGWRLFRQEMGNTVLTGVFYIIASAIVGLVVLLPIFPIWFGLAGQFFANGLSASMIWRLVPIIAYLFVAGIVVGGIVQAYFATLWTKLYKVSEGNLSAKS